MYFSRSGTGYDERTFVFGSDGSFFCLLSDASDAGIFLLVNRKKDDFRAKVGE